MTLLAPRTAQNLIETALLQQLVLGAQQRRPPVADIAALRALSARAGASSAFRSELEVVFVVAANACYLWSTASTAADNGATVIRPTDTAAGATGRWVRAASTERLASTLLHQVETGPVAVVLLVYGALDDDELDAILAGRRPAIILRPRSDTPQTRTGQPCALYEYTSEFEILTLSTNLRGGGLAARGSPVSGEDPGVNYLDGLAWELLAGSSLGLEGVLHCEVGEGRIERADPRQQRFVRSRRLTVLADVGSTANDGDLVAVESLRVQQLHPVDLTPIGDRFVVPLP